MMKVLHLGMVIVLWGEAFCFSLIPNQLVSYRKGERLWSTTSSSSFQDDNHNNSQKVVVPRRRPAITKRGIRRIEKFARLPVWPAWNGVLIWMIGKLFGNDIAAKLEDSITGRVGPNFYNYAETSPYIMLVHHCHSFHPLDPFRYIQRTFFPEGFPAHPHRGFITITYILHGGFVHRDSVGIKQTYGAESHHQGKHTQWLMTGKGILHEEMFDLRTSRQELYQIWLNIPANQKWNRPYSVLLGGGEETPAVVVTEHDDDNNNKKQSKTLILAGRYQEKTARVQLYSDMVLFHVTLDPCTSWMYEIPQSYATAFLYVRKGSLMTTCVTTTNPSADDVNDVDIDPVLIPVHHTAYLDALGDTVELLAGADGADFLFLAGVPLREPCVASGSMVMTNSYEIDQAYADYQRGLLGMPWSEKLSDSEWMEHVRKHGAVP